MKTTLFKRTKTLLAIGFALFTTFTSLNANVFAAEKNLIEYVNSNTKFSFQGPDNSTYEFSLVKLLEESALPNPSEKQIADAKTIGVQFTVTTKNNQTLSWESIIVSQNGELTASEINFNNYIELSRIITKHLVTDELQLKMYDLQYDGYIDVRDIVALENRYYSCPTNFLILNGQKMSLDIFSSLLAEHKNEAIFKIYSTDKPTIIETTTDEPVITTIETSITTDNFSETENYTTSIVTTTPYNEETTDIITTTSTEITTTQETTIVTVPEESAVTSIITTTPATEETTAESEITIVKDTITEPEITTVNETTTAPEVTTLPETTVPEETTTESNTLPVDSEGWEIDQEIYDALVNSAELFGIDNYKIVWSEEEILYSIIYINDWFANSYDLQQQWGVQLCDVQEVREENPEFIEEYFLNDTLDFLNFVWRPCLIDDEQDKELSWNKDIRYELFWLKGTGYTPWKYQHWCLIPLDSKGNENLRFLYQGNKS